MKSNMVKCKYCNGTGSDGQDRCYPPNDYICYVCNGSGKITHNRNEIVTLIEDLYYAHLRQIQQDNGEKVGGFTTYTCPISALQHLDFIMRDEIKNSVTTIASTKV